MRDISSSFALKFSRFFISPHSTLNFNSSILPKAIQICQPFYAFSINHSQNFPHFIINSCSYSLDKQQKNATIKSSHKTVNYITISTLYPAGNIYPLASRSQTPQNYQARMKQQLMVIRLHDSPQTISSQKGKNFAHEPERKEKIFLNSRTTCHEECNLLCCFFFSFKSA